MVDHRVAINKGIREPRGAREVETHSRRSHVINSAKVTVTEEETPLGGGGWSRTLAERRDLSGGGFGVVLGGRRRRPQRLARRRLKI